MNDKFEEPLYRGLPAALIVGAAVKGEEKKFLDSGVTDEFRKSMRGIPDHISKTHMEAEVLAAEALSERYCGTAKVEFCNAVRLKLGLKKEEALQESKQIAGKIETMLGSFKRLAAAVVCASLIFNAAGPAAAELNNVLDNKFGTPSVTLGTGISAGGGSINSEKDIVNQEGKAALESHGGYSAEIAGIRESRIEQMKSDAKGKMVKVFAEANNRLPQKTLEEYAGYMIDASEKYKISPFRLGGITIKESTLKKNARSSANALGLTQVMPSVHIDMLKKRFPNMIRKSTDLFNPKASIYAGALIYKMYEDAVGEKYVLHRYNGVKKKYWNKPGFSYKSKIEKWEDRMIAAESDKEFDWAAFNSVFDDDSPKYTDKQINRARYIAGVEQITGVSESEKRYIANALGVKPEYTDKDKAMAEKIVKTDLFMTSESSPLAMLYAKLPAESLRKAPPRLLNKLKLSLSFAWAREDGEDKKLFASMKDEVDGVIAAKGIDSGVYFAEQTPDKHETTDVRTGYGFKILLREEDIYGEPYPELEGEPSLG